MMLASNGRDRQRSRLASIGLGNSITCEFDPKLAGSFLVSHSGWDFGWLYQPSIQPHERPVEDEATPRIERLNVSRNCRSQSSAWVWAAFLTPRLWPFGLLLVVATNRFRVQ